MIAGAHREVLFRFKGQLDPSVKRSLGELSQLTARTEATRQRAIRQTADTAATAAREEAASQREYVRMQTRRIRAVEQRTRLEERLEERAARVAQRGAEIAARTRQKEADASARAVEMSMRESTKAWTQRTREEARATAASEREQRRYATAYQSAMVRVSTANDQIAEGFTRTLTGVTSLTRGFAMLGLLGEKDTQKLLLQLVKIQAAFDIMRGAVYIVTGLNKAWRAYTAAVKAAAAAHAALTAAQTASAAAGLRSAVTSAAAATTGGAAGSAAATAVGVGTGAVIASIAPLVAAGVVLTGAVVGIAALVNEDFREGLLELIGWTDKEAELREKMVKRLQRIEDEETNRKRISETRETIRRARAEANPPNPFAELAAARAAVMEAYAPGGVERGLDRSKPDRAIANQRELDALNRIKGIREEELKTVRQAAGERIQAAKEELRLTETTLERRKQERAILQERYLSAAERFAQRTPAQRATAVEAKRKADTQGWRSLTQRERNVLRDIGLESTTAIARRGDVEEARRLGFERVFGHEERLGLAAGRRREELLQQRLDAGVRVDNQVTVKLDTNADQMAKELGNAIERRMKPFFDDVLRQIANTKVREAERADAEQRWRMAQQGALR